MSPSSVLSASNLILAIGSLAVLAYALVATTFTRQHSTIFNKITPIVLVIASIGVVLGPLTYQYYLGFPACTLCWYQRIFMFPIAFMAMFAYWKNQADRNTVLRAIKWLAPVGLIFSIWHYVSQWGLTSTAAACGTVGQSVSCDGIDVIVWGFMTIPLMAGLGFISLFLMIWTMTKKS